MSSSAAVMTGGRRREALLRPHAEKLREQKLGPADVETLQRDRSPAARAKVAAKFGRQFDELCAGNGRPLADAVLELLVRDLAVEVRQALALAVAASAALPPKVAQQLAEDGIEIARPILEQSPVLTDEDLIRVVRTHALQYGLAVAGRSRVSEIVAEVLVASGHDEVVRRLIDNAGAAISQDTLQRVIQDFRSDDQIHTRLVRRPALPYEVVEQLIGVLGDRLEWSLVRDRRLPPDEARALMAAVRERAAISFTARAHADSKLQQHLLGLLAAGALGHEQLLAFLRDGEIASLEIGLALHARLDLNQVRQLLYHADRRHLAALCIAASFATPHYITLRMALEIAEEATGPRTSPGGYNPETIRFLQLQYERLRLDEAKLRLLLGN